VTWEGKREAFHGKGRRSLGEGEGADNLQCGTFMPYISYNTARVRGTQPIQAFLTLEQRVDAGLPRLGRMSNSSAAI